jgi:hypothetical protein
LPDVNKLKSPWGFLIPPSGLITKKLFWDKLPNFRINEHAVWMNDLRTTLARINIDDILGTFAMKVQEMSAQPSKVFSKVVTVLSEKKVLNVNILLSSKL